MSNATLRHVTVLDTKTHADVAFVETVGRGVALRIVPPAVTETLDEPGARITLTAGEARELAAALILHADKWEAGS